MENPKNRTIFVIQKGVKKLMEDLKRNNIKFTKTPGNRFILDNEYPQKINMAIKMVKERNGINSIKEIF